MNETPIWLTNVSRLIAATVVGGLTYLAGAIMMFFFFGFGTGDQATSATFEKLFTYVVPGLFIFFGSRYSRTPLSMIPAAFVAYQLSESYLPDPRWWVVLPITAGWVLGMVFAKRDVDQLEAEAGESAS